MKRISLVLSILALCALSANAALTLYDDFESYPNVDIDPADGVYDNGINMKGLTTDRGNDIEKWNSQVNNGNRMGNDQYSRVETFGDNNYLIIANRDQRTDTLSTCTTTCFFGDDLSFFAAEGTLYLQFMADEANDAIMGTNGFEPGYFSDVVGDAADPDNLYQGVGAAPYSRQGQLVRLGGGDQVFHARDGGAYVQNTSFTLPSDTWMELWIDLDTANMRSRYYLAIDGGARQRVDSPSGSEWWGWRNLDKDFAMNMMINQGGSGFAYETNIIVDNMAINPSAFDSGSFDLEPNPWDVLPPMPGDANHDDRVDIDDFVILKRNYNKGPGMTWEDGDFNYDGYVNIEDFVILKQHYNTSR